MDFESILSDALGAAGTIVPALTGTQKASTSSTIQANPTTTTAIKPTATASFMSYLPWIAGIGLALIGVVFFIMRRK